MVVQLQRFCCSCDGLFAKAGEIGHLGARIHAALQVSLEGGLIVRKAARSGVPDPAIYHYAQSCVDAGAMFSRLCHLSDRYWFGMWDVGVLCQNRVDLDLYPERELPLAAYAFDRHTLILFALIIAVRGCDACSARPASVAGEEHGVVVVIEIRTT